jgi:prepilin-type N-terminal cleavage/methylation domain-containing protein
MSKSKGFTLVEVMVAILILTIVITTTIAMFVERHKRLRQANETILAYQALSNEAEIWRRIGFPQLDAPPMAFRSDTAILAPLTPYTTSVHIDTPRPDVKNVTFTIRWANTQREAKLSIVRADTGGSNLW